MTDRLAHSRFFPALTRHYKLVPSVLLCRVPELELAADLPFDGAVLDHCCGDARFAEMAWPRPLDAGCDLDAASIEQAKKRARHRRLAVADASKHLPYDDEAFAWVFNNSALEHIPDLDAALAEVARVTRRGGHFAFNVLNHRYFEWWPAEAPPAAGYRDWQPFHHAFDLATWTRHLDTAGFEVMKVSGYFAPEAARMLALLDAEFSGDFFGRHRSELARRYRSSWFERRRWLKRIGDLGWRTDPDAGAGYCIVARRRS